MIRLQREVQELRKAVNGELKELEDKVRLNICMHDKGLAEEEQESRSAKLYTICKSTAIPGPN